MSNSLLGKNALKGAARTALALTVSLAAYGTANADVVFDALSGATAIPAFNADGSFNTFYYPYQAFSPTADPFSGSISEAITSLGDQVVLSPNTGRAITGVDVGFVQARNSPSVSFQVLLSIYDSPTATGTNPLVTQLSAPVTLPAAGPSPQSLGVASIASLAFGPFNLPDTFYYTLSVVPAGGGAVPSNFGIWLWDYYAYGTPGSIPVGTDVGTTGSVGDFSLVTPVWGTVAGSPNLTTALGAVNQASLSDGYTPAIRFNVATPVPEPTTYGLMAIGLLAVAFAVRRQASQR